MSLLNDDILAVWDRRGLRGADEPPAASSFSQFYTLEELTRTSHGPNPITDCVRYGKTVSKLDVEENIKALCADILDPLSEIYGKIPLSSCYRDPLVNVAVGGSQNSAHTAGLAADIQPVRAAEVVAACARNAKIASIDRVIFEERRDRYGKIARWLHVQRLQRGAPAKDKALFFNSPKPDKYDAISVEQLVALVVSISKRVPT